MQRPRYYLSGLTAKVVLGAGFPWMVKIEETWPVIKEEMLAARGRARKHQQNQLYGAARRVDHGRDLGP